ncbi:hypothetical protein GF352_03790, partial [archaeon]|nr:hypothetical protein [archaeon]
MRTSKLVKYYSQKGFRDFMLRFSKGREVVPQFRGRFGSRPQTYRFDSELLNSIRRGASSFHFSEERWTNPMTLSTEMKDKELNNLRAGWDLVFDVDSRVLDYTKICTKLVIDALDFHGIEEVSVKYSGGSGFHVGVRFDNPTSIKSVPVKNLFPKAPRIIGLYVQEMIKDYLKEMLL